MDDRDVINIDNLVESIHDQLAQIIHVHSPHNGVTVDFVNRVRAVMVNEVGIGILKLKSCEEKDWFTWYQEWLVLVISLEGIQQGC